MFVENVHWLIIWTILRDIFQNIFSLFSTEEIKLCEITQWWINNGIISFLGDYPFK